MHLTRLALTASLLLPAGCGGTLYVAMNATSPRPPAEVFDCVKQQVPILGFTQASYDADAQRLTARRHDYATPMSDTRFRRVVDRLIIAVAKPAEGGARLKVEAHTFAELATQRGPTEVEQSASPAARAAAQALLEACGS